MDERSLSIANASFRQTCRANRNGPGGQHVEEVDQNMIAIATADAVSMLASRKQHSCRWRNRSLIMTRSFQPVSGRLPTGRCEHKLSQLLSCFHQDSSAFSSVQLSAVG